MNILAVQAADKQILPIRVRDTDLGAVLRRMKFQTDGLPGQVTTAYVDAALAMHRDAGGVTDILGNVIRRNFPEANDGQVGALRHRIGKQHPRKPSIPWALYELVLEEVRADLECEGVSQATDPTTFPFLLGVYSIVAHPGVVAAAAFGSIERLIGLIHTFGAKLNTVTEINALGKPVYDPGDGLMIARFRREQDPAELARLHMQLSATAAQGMDVDAATTAICQRDLALTLGALVGGSILKGQRIRYTKVQGDSAAACEITIAYPRAPRGLPLKLGLLGNAGMLAVTHNQGDASIRRQAYMTRTLGSAQAALDAATLARINATIEDDTRTAVQMHEAGVRAKQLQELARDAAHHVKNPAGALMGLMEQLYFDEDALFAEVREITDQMGAVVIGDVDYRYAHRDLIKRIATDSRYSITGLEGGALHTAIEQRLEAYEDGIVEINEQLEAAGRPERLDYMRDDTLSGVVGTYAYKMEHASINIVDALVEKLCATGGLDAEEIERLAHHQARKKKGLLDAERIAKEIIARTGTIRAIGEEDHDIYQGRETLDLYDIVERGTLLLTTQAERPALLVHQSVRGAQVESNAELTRKTLENVTWNAYEAISGKQDRHPHYEHEAIIVVYDAAEQELYVANTGPGIEDGAIEERLFSLEKKGVRATTVLKGKTSSGTSLPTLRTAWQSLGGNLVCYAQADVAALTAKHEVLGAYKPNVVFGIQFSRK